MTLKQSTSPYGYRTLLVYKKAAELQAACAELTAQFPKQWTLTALADQMDRSARSVKQNIVEGETVRGTVARPDRGGGRRAAASSEHQRARLEPHTGEGSRLRPRQRR